MKNYEDKIRWQLWESAALMHVIGEDMAEEINKAAGMIIDSYRSGGKLILFGNGGSAADAQHIAGELVGRFLKERPALPAIAFNNVSVLTAIGNDYGFDTIFARQMEAWAKRNDTAMGISTSGNSQNVILGIEKAQSIGGKTIGLTGGCGGELAQIVELALIIPSCDTARIQEAHITIGHILCDIVEADLFGNPF